MSRVQMTKQSIIKADGADVVSTSNLYTRARTSSVLNIDYTLGFVEIGNIAQISESSIEANHFYEI